MNTPTADILPGTLPGYLQPAWQQAAIAVDCLANKLTKVQTAVENGTGENAMSDNLDGGQGHPLLPYLIHASVLLFLVRDMLAYEWIRRQTAFLESPLTAKIRQTPTVDQAAALLKSVEKTKPLAATIETLQDKSLNAESLRLFRNHTVQWGIPLNAADNHTNQLQDAPFPLPVLDYVELSHAGIQAWDMLQRWWERHEK